MDTKRIEVVIVGRVQGVGFRASCQHEATALGLTGWVRNRWDGAVEALLEGPAQAVDEMLRWCHHGPPAAQVSRVEVSDAPDAPPATSFRIKGW